MIKQMFEQAFPNDALSQEMMEYIILTDLIFELYGTSDTVIDVITRYKFANFNISYGATSDDCTIRIKCFPNSQWTSFDYYSTKGV